MKIGIDTDSRALRGLSMSSAAGHNLSQGDLESEGESEKNPANTGTGCYKNYDHHQLHHRRSNQQHSHPEPDAQQPSYSPVPQRREWSADTNNDQDDIDNDNEQLIESEEQQKMQSYMRASKVEVEELRRQIAMENQLKDPKVSRRVKTDIEIPSEFECCFCSSDDYKECIDAEGLMPLNTSDIQKTICMEMHMAKTMNILNLCHGGTKSSSSFATPSEHNIGPNKFTFPSIDAAVRSIPTVNSRENRNNASLNSKHSQSAVAVAASNNNNTNSNPVNSSSNLVLNQNYNVHNSTNTDLASVDSSDTFMSCQTHPFLSQGDLTSTAQEFDDNDLTNLCDFDMIDSDNMYMTSPYGHMSNKNFMRGGSLYSGPVNIIVDSTLSAQNTSQVKKSTSGDTALKSLAAVSPIDDQYSGSRVSLNETPVPKHRKTRFQQQQQQQQPNNNNLNKPKTRFDDGCVGGDESGAESSNINNTNNNSKKNRRASFMPSKIITTATKQLINQHLFGLQSMSSSKDGSIETHKRSKSILKNKSDARLGSDPESERLLSDTGSGVSDISVIPADGNLEFSPNKIHKSISPQLSHHRHHRLVQQRSTPASFGRTKFSTPRQTEETMLRQVKPMLQRGLGFGGTTTHDSARLDSGTRESSLDSDNAYSTTTYPLMAAKDDRDKDESSSSTIKASNDQIATSSSTLDKQNNSSTLSTTKCTGGSY